MFEFKNDFLMGQRAELDGEEQALGFCFAAGTVEDDFDQLASLVGSQSTLKPSNKDDQIQLVDQAPTLEFDLEDELARAFETDEAIATAKSEPEVSPIADPVAIADIELTQQPAPVAPAPVDPAPVEPLQAAGPSADVTPQKPARAPVTTPVAPPETQPAPSSLQAEIDKLQAALNLSVDGPSPDPVVVSEPVPETAPVDELPSDFSEMIADELDKALTAEVEADAALTQPEPVVTNDGPDIDAELSRLMGEVADSAPHTTVGAVDGPPPPPEAVDPWQGVDIAQTLNLPKDIVAEPEPIAAPSYSPSRMTDFDPASIEMAAAQEYPAELSADHTNITPEEIQSPEQESGSHIDHVLGGAAALAAAAAPTSSSAQPVDEPTIASSDPVVDVQDFEISGSLEIADDNFDHHDSFSEPPDFYEEQKRSSGRKVAFAIVAVALLGGTAALGWNLLGGGDSETPTLMASTDPVKVKPKDAGGKIVPNQDQAVYQNKDANGGAVATQDRLKDSREEPINVSVTPDATKTDARVDTTKTRTVSPGLVKPRSVRTVVVRPDGTIVSSNPQQPSSSDIQTFNVPTPSLDLQEAVSNQGGEITTQSGQDANSQLQTAAVKKVEETTAPAKKVITINPQSSASQAPASSPGLPAPTASTPNVEAPKEVAAVQPAPPAPKAAAPKPVETKAAETPAPKPQAPKEETLPSVSSPYAVQISSQRSSAAAKQTYSTLSRRYASILQGKGVDIQKAVIKGKGTYYRVRIPAQSRAAANDICSQLKAQGGDCFVTR
ncbi:MAG: SPOR domain-containing protein [Rhizobiaceae bacterium]